MDNLTLFKLDQPTSICRLPPDESVPEWAHGEFTSITRTSHELSVVCATEHVPSDVTCESGWRVLGIQGPLDFSLIGVLAAVTDLLRQANVSVFVVSTYDTDYLLVKQADWFVAEEALRSAGHCVL